MLRFASLGSGSRGNCTLITSARCSVLVDCGFSTKETVKRLTLKGFRPEDIDAIFVTHEHGDHGNGVGRFGRRYSVPIYGTAGTLDYIDTKNCEVFEFQFGDPIQLDDLSVFPIKVPHDAREPSQFIFEHGGKRVGILTDLGHVTRHVVDNYRTCHALLLEANHCVQKLWMGPYPESLKHRIAGEYGHLSNDQSMEFVDQLDPDTLDSIVLAHLSEENNSPTLVDSLFARFRSTFTIQLASQDSGSDWVTV